VGQLQRPGDVLRFPATGGVPEKLPGGADENTANALLPDGRILLVASLSGRSRLMAARPGKDPVPFVLTEDETSWPFALMGERGIAFEIGALPNRTLAVASASDGRMVRRLPATKGFVISSLASSPDGGTLYYVHREPYGRFPLPGGILARSLPGTKWSPIPPDRS